MTRRLVTTMIASFCAVSLLSSCATLPFELSREEPLGLISLSNGSKLERRFTDLPYFDELYKVYLRTPEPIPDAVKQNLRVKIVIHEIGFHVAPVAYTARLSEFAEADVGSIAVEYVHPDTIGGGFLPRPYAEYAVRVAVREMAPVPEQYEAEVVFRAGPASD